MDSVIKFKLNDHDEIEYSNVDESKDASAGDESDPDPSDDHTDGDDDDDVTMDNMALVPTGDGVMTIQKRPKTVVEHVCAKCNKSYKSLMALKRHLNLCRHLPNMENVTKIPNLQHDVHSIGNEAAMDDKCFCCFEDKALAHNGFIACNFCPKSFSSHVHLERHLYTLHSASSRWPCEICNATCPNQEILALHMATHDEGKPFSCQNCGKDFTRKYHLDRHLEYTGCDGGRVKQQLPCKVCGKAFTRLDNLREHLRVHLGQPSRRREYECPFCSKPFYGSSLLNIHIRTHTGERPFPCDLCDNHFPSNGALRKHRRKHTGERPYPCSLCTKAFSVKETLNRHMKTHTGERPHKCTQCDKAFIQATQLRAHMVHHSAETQFTCDICDATFLRRRRLETHMLKLHSGGNGAAAEHKYKCDVCHSGFKLKSRLAAHLTQHIRNAAVEQRKLDGGGGAERPKRKYTKRIKTVDEDERSVVIKDEKGLPKKNTAVPAVEGAKRRGRPPGKAKRLSGADQQASKEVKQPSKEVKVESVVIATAGAVDGQLGAVYTVQHVDEDDHEAAEEHNQTDDSLLEKSHTSSSAAVADRPVRCKLCKHEFGTLGLLVTHMKENHLDALMTMMADDEPTAPIESAKSSPSPAKRLSTSKTTTGKRQAATASSSAAVIKRSHPNRFNVRTSNASHGGDDDAECNEYEVEIIDMKDEPEDKNPPPPIPTANPCDVPIMLTADELTDNISKLLNLLVDEQTLTELGWPVVDCEAVLADVIAQCGQAPADRSTCPDYETVMRENAKLLFTTVISNDSIKSLLNNHSVDEVILHVLKLAT